MKRVILTVVIGAVVACGAYAETPHVRGLSWGAPPSEIRRIETGTELPSGPGLRLS